jgi:hypothetical protein
MPLQKLTYRPGLNREGTNYSNEGGFYDGDKIRFRSGQAEKIGGWVQVTSAKFLGLCRSLWAWLDLTALNNYLGLGTTSKYYIYFGGAYNDITPIVQTDSLSNPFKTSFSTLNGAISATATSLTLTSTAGFPSAGIIQIDIEQIAYTSISGNVLNGLVRGYNATTAVTHTTGSNVGCSTIIVTDASYNPGVGDYILMNGSYTVGGITLSGQYVVTSHPSLTTYTFDASTFSTSSTTGGGSVSISYLYPSGSDEQVAGTGWGAGTWGGATSLTLTNLIGPFTTNSTSTITVTQVGHGLSTGQWINFTSVSADVAGIPKIIFQQDFQVTVTGANTYTISMVFGSITYTANTTASGLGGNVTVALPNSPVRAWNTAYASGINNQIRLWTNDNYGADLVIAPRGGPIFYWQDSLGLTVRASYLSALANASQLAASTAVFGSAVTTITVSNPNNILPYSYITGTNIAAGTYVTNAYIPGSTSVPISVATTGVNDSNNYSFSYAGSFVPTKTNQAFTSSIQQFVIAFGSNPYSPTNPSTTFNPMTVRWSDQANPYQWVPQVTNQSGEFTLTNGSYIMCGQTTRQENLIWTNSCLYSMQYVGYPYVWSFQVLMDNISIMSPNSAVTVNNVTYWMGNDKFYMYTGVVQTLPCSLRQYVFDDINSDQAFQVFSGANEAYNEVWWFYCSKGSGTIDKYVIYNYLDKVWSYGTMARTAWLQYSINPYPIAADYNSRLLNHEVGNDDVSTATPAPINAYVQSSDFGIEAGDHLGFVWRMLPDINFNGSTVANPSVTMTLFGKANSGAAPQSSDVDMVVSGQNYTSKSQYTIQTYDGQVYTRIRGRQLSFKIESTALGVAWQLGIPRIDVKPAGRR